MAQLNDKIKFDMQKRIVKMRKTAAAVFILIFILNAVFLTALAEDKKLGQTGFQFLGVGSDARAGGLANSVTTLELGASSLFYNPAGMARMTGLFNLTVTQNNWIDDIKHNSYSLAFNPADGRYGVVALSFISVDYGEVQGTMVWDNEQGFIDTEILNPSAFAVGLGYAKHLTNKFAVGGHLKYSGQQLGHSVIPVGVDNDSLKIKKNIAYATAFDFGTIYRTGFKSLIFGMSIRNFSNEITYEETSFQLPLTFTIGISMDLVDILDESIIEHTLNFSVEALHPRSYPEQLNLGLEYIFLKTFALRAGYMFVSDEQKVSFGFGIQKFGFGLDYAYTPFGVFDNVQRFTIRFGL
jgi:hypothetical protein